MNVITFESEDDALDIGFCQWFVGVVDALGQFKIQVNQNHFCFLFDIATTQNQIQVLNYIRTNLGIGHIALSNSHINNMSFIHFRVTNQSEISKLIVVLEEFPLRSYVKTDQFSLWVDTYEIIQRHPGIDDEFYHDMLERTKRLGIVSEHPAATHPTHRKKADHTQNKNQLSLFGN